MNIKVNRSHGLGYRCKELGVVYQTQSSMRKSRNLVKSMGSQKKKTKNKKINIYRQMLLHIFNLSNFPRSATLHILLFGKITCVCVYTDN